jgi:hypothetical protein
VNTAGLCQQSLLDGLAPLPSTHPTHFCLAHLLNHLWWIPTALPTLISTPVKSYTLLPHIQDTHHSANPHYFPLMLIVLLSVALNCFPSSHTTPAWGRGHLVIASFLHVLFCFVCHLTVDS